MTPASYVGRRREWTWPRRRKRSGRRRKGDRQSERGEEGRP